MLDTVIFFKLQYNQYHNTTFITCKKRHLHIIIGEVQVNHGQKCADTEIISPYTFVRILVGQLNRDAMEGRHYRG